MPAHPTAPIQAKLTVNAPGDTYEREADRIADHVMSTAGPQLQRACPCGGGCPRCGQTQSVEPHAQFQTKGVQANDHAETEAPSLVYEAVRSPGQPLDPSTRTFMEPRLGYDFGEVRVHTDARSAESARAVNARAYTLNREIVFGSGQYRPEDSEGKRLLAHELVHVTQQSGAEVIRRASPEPLEKPWTLPDVATRQAQVDAVVPPGVGGHCVVDPAPRLEPIGGKLHIDIGGEGKYSEAYNLNPTSKGTVPPWAGKDIPHHVCGVGENIPVPSASVDYITVESTPIGRDTVSEIARTIKRSGHVRLQHPDTPEYRRWHNQVAIAVGMIFVPPKAEEMSGVKVLITRIGPNSESLP